MELSPANIAEIKQAIREINMEFPPSYCPLDDTAKVAAREMYALIRDVGDGDASAGVRLIRRQIVECLGAAVTTQAHVDDHRFVAFMRSMRTKALGIPFLALCGAMMGLFGWIGVSLWEALKTSLK